MRNWFRFAFAGLVLAVLANTTPAQERTIQQGDLKAGDPAPDFTAQSVDGKKTVKLFDLKGKPVVLVFGSCT